MKHPIRIYVEGDLRLRRGFHKFFGGGERIRVIAGRSGPEARKDFLAAKADHPGSIVLLLVDAEKSLAAAPRDPNAFFMIQVMESWFLADRERLGQYFGDGFKAKALPGSPKQVESIPKRDVLRGLDAATKQCGGGQKQYGLAKAKHGGELLSRIRPALVRAASPECERLFQAFGLP